MVQPIILYFAWKSNKDIFFRSKMISKRIKSTVVWGSWKINMCVCDIKAVWLMKTITFNGGQSLVPYLIGKKINMLTALN